MEIPLANTTTCLPSKIVWSEPWKVHIRGCLLDHLPDRLF